MNAETDAPGLHATLLGERIQQIIATHFDPRWGAPYWIEKRLQLPFNPILDIRTCDDLRLFPPMSRNDLATRSVYDFLPRRFHDHRAELVLCETGGTTGPPARTLFLDTEFSAAFVTPFVSAAELLHFPEGVDWLFIGPTGPHPIGKAARRCALATGSLDPFMVDFDPRWARRLSGFALDRYRAHVVQQAMQILTSQQIGVIFATPPVLANLGEALPLAIREQISGIHTGGIAPEAAFWERLTGEWFGNATVMSGYGNSLAGMCPQICSDPSQPPAYFPHGDRLIFEVLEPEPGARGQVCFHRLDESCFLPRVLERDAATLAAPPANLACHGFHQLGLLDPRSVDSDEAKVKALY